MKFFRIRFLWLIATAASFLSSYGQTTATTVVATTTLIETAVRDLLGPQVAVTRLLPPGACPGHFDLDPQQVVRISTAAIFIRHDYQDWMTTGFAITGAVISITSRPSFAIPNQYAALCAELGDRLAQLHPDWRTAIEAHRLQITEKAAQKEKDLQVAAQSFRGQRVACAVYQRDFCAWLGLDVVAVFSAGTEESAWQFNRTVDQARTADAVAVIGNQQWGPQHIRALSEAAGLPGIMLSNFPETGEAGAYWTFVDDNLARLQEVFP